MSTKTTTTGCHTKVKLDPKMYKVANALCTILGFDTFEDYVSHCVRQNVEMFIEGGDDIAEYFHDAYKHLMHKGPRADPKKTNPKEEGIITR
jgi:hypothetical protein